MSICQFYMHMLLLNSMFTNFGVIFTRKDEIRTCFYIGKVHISKAIICVVFTC